MDIRQRITIESTVVVGALALIFFVGLGAAWAASGTAEALVQPELSHEVLPAAEEPSQPLEISGWIPYWSTEKGTRDARKRLDVLSAVYPFVYTIKSDGTLKENADMDKVAWQRLFREARREGVLVIPTIMTEGGTMLHAILSDEQKRAAHIGKIVEMVERGGYDGVDIDYEAKLVKTRDYFSLFLKELETALPEDKMITCAIESRTPADSLYANVPADLKYSNDLVAIGTYCDRVAIMGYDQRNADIKLNAEKNGAEPYLPVADADWVRKVIREMSTQIPKDKLVLGVPTYGHEYTVTVNAKGRFVAYDRIRAVNPDTALSLADKHGAETSRTSAGEIAFTYRSKNGKLAGLSTIPDGTPPGLVVAERARAYAKQYGRSTTFNYVTWSDAAAIEEKIALATETGIAGIAIFKIDGQEDPELWDLFTKDSRDDERRGGR